MAINFYKDVTKLAAMEHSKVNPENVYFPSDTDNIILNGKEYGIVVEDCDDTTDYPDVFTKSEEESGQTS